MDRDQPKQDSESRVGASSRKTLRTEHHPERSVETPTAERGERGERGSQLRAASVNSPHAVVLRADLRGFTKTAERLTPEGVLPMLDEYVDFVSNIARENGGEVYGADPESVTVGFGLRTAKANGSAGAAVRTAKQLLDGFEEVSNRWRERLDARVALSIGIHEGEVLAAPLGSSSNRSPRLVGDTVNVAARLAQRARAGEAVLSASVREALRDQVPEVQIKPLGGLSFAARAQRVDIYCIPRPDRLELGEPRREITRH
jgi:adenylate cyclase